MIGDFLYEISQRDMQLSWLDPLFHRERITTATASISVEYTVPLGRVLLLSSAVASAVAGSLLTTTLVSIGFVKTSASSEFDLMVLPSDQLTTAAKNRYSANWSGRVTVPQDWIIKSSAAFSGTTDVNSLTLSLIGMLIPIGNIQRT